MASAPLPKALIDEGSRFVDLTVFEMRQRMRFRTFLLRYCLLAFLLFNTLPCIAQNHSQIEWFCPISGVDILAGLFDTPRSTKADSAIRTTQPFEELTGPQLDYMSKVLDVWQARSSKANIQEFGFNLEIFDAAANCGKYPAIKEIGYLIFTQPNKWLFRIDSAKNFSRIDDTLQPCYAESSNINQRSLWYFDGSSLKTLDRTDRKCLSMPLADESLSSSKTENRFPFVVDKQELQKRFWIRPIANPTDDLNVWIEFWPRLKSDQRNFSRLQVVLDHNSVSVKKMYVFLANWRPGYENREVYEFWVADD